jgi:hypothetical protein
VVQMKQVNESNSLIKKDHRRFNFFLFIVVVPNVTACFLINLCNLCGTNPPRGICLPEKNVSSCECFNYPNDPSMSYVGEFCLPQKNDLTTSSSSTWVPIVIGVLSGIGGVFCMITCCLLLMNYSRYRSQKRNISPQ